MAIEATTASLLLFAASAGATGAGLISSGKQQKLDLANLELETEQAKLAAEEQAFTQAKNFRGALASQLAISSLRGGQGGSIMRQFGAESMANFLSDQKALDRRQKFIDVSSDLSRATTRSARFSRDFSSIVNLASTGLQAIDLNKLNKTE